MKRNVSCDFWSVAATADELARFISTCTSIAPRRRQIKRRNQIQINGEHK